MGKRGGSGCGCATTGAVDAISSDTIRSYLRRLDAAFAAMNERIVSVMVNAPPKTEDAWRVINGWQMLYARWQGFYWGNVNDFFILDATYQEAQVYAKELENARAAYTRTFRRPAPGEVVVPKDLPAEPGSPLADVATVVKWGVIGYLAVQVVGALRDRK